MINIDLRADDFDLELEKVRIMNQIKKAQRKLYYGCKDLEMCKNYSPDKCTMCVRTTGNADCNDFYDDSDYYLDPDDLMDGDLDAQ